MTNVEMTDAEFCEGFSEADWDRAEAIEAEIMALLKQGLSKQTAFKFVRAVMDARKTAPQTTVEGVFEVALDAGLSYIALATSPRTKPRRKHGKLSRNGA